MSLPNFTDRKWYFCFYLISLLIIEPFSHWMFPLQEFRIIYLYGITGLYLWIPFLINKEITISRFDILLGLICLYNFKGIYQHNLLPEMLLFINLYFASRHLSGDIKFQRLLCYTFSVGGCLQAITVFLQYFSWIESGNPLFRTTGTFDNPGPLGGYMAICLMTSISSLLYFPASKYKKRLLVTGIALQAIALVMSDSRAAWLSALVISLSLMANHLGWKRKKRIVFYILPITAFLMLSLFVYKPDSAKGRLMIWKVSTEMIKEAPLHGKGFATFPEQYMHYQARYMTNFPKENTNYLTSNNCYAFNEFIHIFCEQGIIGIILLCIGIAILFYIAVKSKHPIPLFPSLLVFLIFACFSYPFSVLSLSLLLPMFVGNIISYIPHRIYAIHRIIPSWGIWITCHVALCIGFTCRNQAERKLSDYFYEENEEALAFVEKRYSNLKMSKEFIFKYAKYLYLKAEYLKCIPILQQAILLYPSTDKYIDLGECYQQTGHVKQAESCYNYASQMLPHLIYPPYCLFNLYRQHDNKKEALEKALFIINIKQRRESEFTKKIENEAYKYIQEFQN